MNKFPKKHLCRLLFLWKMIPSLLISWVVLKSYYTSIYVSLHIIVTKQSVNSCLESCSHILRWFIFNGRSRVQAVRILVSSGTPFQFLKFDTLYPNPSFTRRIPMKQCRLLTLLLHHEPFRNSFQCKRRICLALLQ